jgi:hypothetical protein
VHLATANLFLNDVDCVEKLAPMPMLRHTFAHARMRQQDVGDRCSARLVDMDEGKAVAMADAGHKRISDLMT